MKTFPGHVGQPHISSTKGVSQTLVVEPQQVEHRGMQIVHVNFVLHREVAVLVGRAVNHAALYAAARPSTS